MITTTLVTCTQTHGLGPVRSYNHYEMPPFKHHYFCCPLVRLLLFNSNYTSFDLGDVLNIAGREGGWGDTVGGGGEEAFIMSLSVSINMRAGEMIASFESLKLLCC